MFLKLQKPKPKPHQNSKVISGIGLLLNPRSSSSSRLPSFNDSRRTSVRNNSSLMRNSQEQFGSELGSLASSRLLRRPSEHEPTSQQISPVKKTVDRFISIEQRLRNLIEKYSDRTYVIALVEYHQHKWDEDSERFLREQRYNSLIRTIMERCAQFNPLMEDFLTHEYDSLEEDERKLVLSVLLKEYLKLVGLLETASTQVLGRIPDERTIRQESDLFELFRTLLRMYDVKHVHSQEKMRETFVLFSETYSLRKSELLANASQKLRGMMDVVVEVEKYLAGYQKEVVRLQNANKGLERQVEKAKELLEQKVLYTPIEVDYTRIKEIRDHQKKEIFEDLDSNIVRYYKARIADLQKTIAEMETRTNVFELTIRQKDEQISDLKVEVNRLVNAKPQTSDASTQLFLVTSKKTLEAGEATTSNPYDAFLENINTPFQFSKTSTSNIINLFLVDKLLYDYELIRGKVMLKPVRLFLYEWFLMKTGSKKVAQIFCKNFFLSLSQLRRGSKRYHLFSKLAGLLRPKKKNLLQDLDLVFHQTQLVWYYYVKVALWYRKKLNENPSGYPIVPPMAVEDITRLSLRKTYELIDEFFESEGWERPSDLHTKVDLYSINEISKFRMQDEEFQKEQLHEIHILRDINFDVVCGFLVEYASNFKCAVVERFLRALHVRQRQKKAPVTYSEFEAIFKRFYKEKRTRIQLIFARLCLCNQMNVLDIENVRPVVELLLEDETKLRSIYEKLDSLKLLLLSEKAAMKWMEKRTSHPNSFEHLRERYYMDFYDFYDSTGLISDIYNNVKHLIRKCIYAESGRVKDMDINEQEQTEQPPEEKPPGEEQPHEEQDEQKQEDKQDEKEDERSELPADASLLERKVEQFRTIFTKVPKFASRIITIEQMLVHNMRRKDCIDATEYTWRVLREILMLLVDKSDLL